MLITLLALTLAALVSVQGLMFPPHPGPDCHDNGECASGCCLMTSMRHRRPNGVCQNLPSIGEYCAPGHRLRDYSGWRVYTHSCSCRSGLDCVPDWSRRYIAMSVLQDPQCMPANMSALELHVRGYNRPPAAPPGPAALSPRNVRPNVRTPPPS